ncbi:MAG: sigma-70 family RNA polymerase sigma factor [Deltaproteobacteria bacterium]|nr:sigma-70 family RNA polymerase sigma factor [Deltaproteobacteria bacterium]
MTDRPAEASDFDLLDAWAAGDRGAGGQLFTRHFRTVFRFFSNKVTTGSEDLVQQTFLACVETHRRFRRDASFRAFLLGTARNVLYNEFRRRRRKDDRIDFTSMSAMDLAPSPSSIIAEKMEQRQLLEALRSIPIDYQIALELHLWEGLTGPEMAEVLGIAEPGVRSRLRRAKQALGERMAQLRGGGGPLESTSGDLERWAASLREAASGGSRG